MKKAIRLLALSISLVALLAVGGQSPTVATNAEGVQGDGVRSSLLYGFSNTGDNQLPLMAPGVVLVGLEPGYTLGTEQSGVQASDAVLDALLTDTGVRSSEPVFPGLRQSLATSSTNGESDLSRIYRLHLSPNADVLRVVQKLSASPAIAYAEPDYLAHIITTPNDPLYAGQWGLSQINAPAAWNVVTGTADVVIAVVDSGLDTSHPDLIGQLWANPGEIASNGTDDDNNGYVDDIHGWNLVDDNANLSDSTGHGTQVAGVIAATTNNGEGVAGMCWNCRLMVVKVTQAGGVANYSDIAAGVAYAAQKGAEVINLSLGGYSDSATLRAAIKVASQTAVVVGGAGNDDSSAPLYPAAYNDYVLAVAGTTETDTKATTSNYGTWVDVSAPGEMITTTFDGGGYGIASGTSMAAPFASGLAALLRSEYSAWSPNTVRAHIVQTAENINSQNPGYEGQLGSGRIDANQAVTIAAQPLLGYQSHIVDGEPDGRPEPESTVDLDVMLYNEWADATNVQATLSTSDPYVTIITGTVSYGGIAAYGSGTNATSFRFSVSSSAPYVHDISFTLNVTADGGYATTVAFTVTTASGIEYVSGVIATDTIWTNDKQYVATGNVLISEGITLTIEPGTVIRFQGGKVLRIDGKLIAVGTLEEMIMFTSASSSPTAGSWQGIEFTKKSAVHTSTVEHSQIEYASVAVKAYYASPAIQFSRILSNVEGIWCWAQMDVGTTPVLVANNLIAGNNRGIYMLAAFDGIAVIDHNRIVNNDIGIRLIEGSPSMVVRNLIAGNTIGIGSYYGEAAQANTVMSNTIVSNSSAGILIHLQSTTHNNFVNNPYHIRNTRDQSINATNNWWGTTETSGIDIRIYDFADDINLGIVNYAPYLSAPESTAPAFLQDITLSPVNPVGIQTVTLDLAFSRPMDQGVDPTVGFDATEPYTTYQVVDNAQWLDDSHWRATYDVTSLVPRGAYTISVSGAMGTDGMEISTDTRFGFTVDYAGEITDQTPPSPPSVIVGGIQGDASSVEAIWWASDPDSTITGYRYAIGSAPGATDIVNWTFVAAGSSASTAQTTSRGSLVRSGLGLVEGRRYWLAVQARNEGGLWSASAYCAFISGRPYPKAFLPVVMKSR